MTFSNTKQQKLPTRSNTQTFLRQRRSCKIPQTNYKVGLCPGQQRPHHPVRPIPSQLWCKNFGTKDYE
ncbi:hypothetical protein ACSQ67_016047 [Phaseolus vulgaris]